MKASDLFKRKPSGQPKPASKFTEQQAMANRALYEQEIGPMGEGATLFFQEFYVNDKPRRWLLPSVETWRDLDDDQVDFVLKYLVWFKKQIAPIHAVSGLMKTKTKLVRKDLICYWCKVRRDLIDPKSRCPDAFHGVHQFGTRARRVRR